MIQAAGSGAITITTPNNAQTIQAPFTGPMAGSQQRRILAAAVAVPPAVSPTGFASTLSEWAVPLRAASF
ncbi:MAG: hypothetical protein DMG57_05010 [Acidobacteria bacterium]|nr:MAG: hypothetical protein DMG57_05010 [Acidobacteriota bacterium]